MNEYKSHRKEKNKIKQIHIFINQFGISKHVIKLYKKK